MVKFTMNDLPITVEEGTTILEAAEIAGIDIPHLCYLKDINEIGACRMCNVEVEGEISLVPACNTKVREGMVVHTNTPQVRNSVRTNLMLIMSQHDARCSLCDRSGNCQLQKLANDFDFYENTFPTFVPTEKKPWDSSFPLYRDTTRCIKCMRCIQVCNKIQHVGIWDVMATGGKTVVSVSGHRDIAATDCTVCGQCITHCPVGALRERKDAYKVTDAIEDPEITTVVQIAPAVRTAWAEAFGIPVEETNVNQLAGALKQIGFDYVFDTSFSADLTIMEEGNEFLKRLGNGDLDKYPMFTSCCPGWIRFIKSHYPELVGQLSTAKSPQQMFGSVIKTYFAEKIGVPAHKICSVSVMPCTAKKAECDIPSINDSGAKDVDYSLTTREIVKMLKVNNISPENIKEAEFDNICGDYTGAGVIFGTTGGVMEAALRSAAYLVTGKNPSVGAFGFVDPDLAYDTPWQEATYNIGDAKVKVAAVTGLKNADVLCNAIVRGDVKYDFVEVMACPTGCAGGGGQPIHADNVERGAQRGKHLRKLDENMEVRFSHENKDVIKMYEDYFGEPLSEKSEELLHTNHFDWEMPWIAAEHKLVEE